MTIAVKESVSIISGIAVSDIDDIWLTSVDNMVMLLLNRDFASVKSDTQYFDVVNRNMFYVNYDRTLKFVLRCTPVNSVTSVYANPDSDDPDLLTVDDNYFVNLDSGWIELRDTYEPPIGQRMLQVNYNWDYADAPDEVVTYANYLCAFLLESQPAKSADGNLLKEVTIGRYKEAYAAASTALKAKYESFLSTMEELLVQKYKVWD